MSPFSPGFGDVNPPTGLLRRDDTGRVFFPRTSQEREKGEKLSCGRPAPGTRNNKPWDRGLSVFFRKVLTQRPLLDYVSIAMETKQRDMNKEKLVKIVQELLKTGEKLDFLMELQREDLEKLVASIRDGIYRSGEK